MRKWYLCGLSEHLLLLSHGVFYQPLESLVVHIVLLPLLHLIVFQILSILHPLLLPGGGEVGEEGRGEEMKSPACSSW